MGVEAVMNALVSWPSSDLRGPINTLMAPDPLRFNLFSSFQEMSGFQMCGNFWVAGTDGCVDQSLGSMGAGVFIMPPDIRAWTSCQKSFMCGLGTVKGSMGIVAFEGGRVTTAMPVIGSGRSKLCGSIWS